MTNESAATSPLEGQKRGRVIAMDKAELDEFLTNERTVRMATVNKHGQPHVTALWFVWDGEAMWVNSVVKSRRWADFEQRPDVSALVDAGHDYSELQGAELIGPVEIVADDVDTDAIGRMFSQKYRGGEPFVQDKWHRWIRVVPTKVVSWDFRKLPDAKKKPGH